MTGSVAVCKSTINMDDFIVDFRHLVVESINAYFPSGFKTIYVVGSFSSGELTILRNPLSGEVYMSDIDVIVDVDLPTFLKCHIIGIAQKLSKLLTDRITSKGVKTHVSISVTSCRLFNLLRFIKPQNSVYLYELTPIDTNQKHSISSNAKYQRFVPNKLDSLNLVFSSIADYVCAKLDFEKDATHEQIYLLAKRCLTLLYSLLLFNGLHPRTYSERIVLGRRYFDKLSEVLSDKDLKIFEALVDYKLTGDWSHLVQSLPVKQKTINDLLVFLDGYFIELATKVVAYELSRLVHGEKVCRFSGGSSAGLLALLEGYKSKVQVSFCKLPLVVLQYVFSFLARRHSDKLKIALNSLLVRRLRVDDLLRYNMCVVFLSLVSGVPEFEPEFALETKRFWFLYLI